MRIIKFLSVLWNDDVQDNIFEVIGSLAGIISFVVLMIYVPPDGLMILQIIACLLVSAFLGVMFMFVSMFTCYVCVHLYEALENAWYKSK